MRKPVLTGMLPDEIARLLPPGKERYRGMQLFRWIHERGAASFDEMTNIAKALRAEIAGTLAIGAVTLQEHLVSSDGDTGKFLWGLADGKTIESVIIRDGPRVTACISSQVGCRFGCTFCRTGTMGLVRNLTAGEIVDQLIRMRSILATSGETITNVVFMGMGEPLDNLDAVSQAITIITMETGLGFGQRKITVSTCGVVPGMLTLAERFKNIGLAISLNAPGDRLRTELMPVNRAYPLATLLDATRRFHDATRRRITFEYILMKGVNDSPAQAIALAKIVRTVPSKVNLIVLNEHGESHYRRPGDRTVDEFRQILIDHHITAMLRKSKGSDILAACGQLAARSGDC